MAREEKSTEEQKMIDEWLAKGNKVTICPPNTRTDSVEYVYGWGKKKKKKVTPKEVDSK